MDDLGDIILSLNISKSFNRVYTKNNNVYKLKMSKN